jgi:hypothetical protein
MLTPFIRMSSFRLRAHDALQRTRRIDVHTSGALPQRCQVASAQHRNAFTPPRLVSLFASLVRCRTVCHATDISMSYIEVSVA